MSKTKTIFCPNVVRFESNESDLTLLNDFKNHREVRGSLAIAVWPVDNTAFIYGLKI
jgi:hypothetical protein